MARSLRKLHAGVAPPRTFMLLSIEDRDRDARPAWGEAPGDGEIS